MGQQTQPHEGTSPRSKAFDRPRARAAGVEGPRGETVRAAEVQCGPSDKGLGPMAPGVWNFQDEGS